MKQSQLNSLQARIGHSFQNPGLLIRALTHPSFLQDHPQEKESNQRLELLGDSVLEFVLTDTLFHLYPEEREGPLSKRRAVLSRGNFLAILAREIGLDACLRLSQSEEQCGGRDRDPALEDALEAVIGAVFLDAGIDTVRQVIKNIYGSFEQRISSQLIRDNPKGRLQEIAQAKIGPQVLSYQTVHVSGEDHAREYESTLYLMDKAIGKGRSTSKKSAEEAAAMDALSHLPQELAD